MITIASIEIHPSPRPVLIITRGLPGCGKTTRALAWVAENELHRARVGRDAIRRNVFGSSQPVLGVQAENVVTELQRRMIRTLLSNQISVVADDTNLPNTRIASWRAWAARLGISTVVWDMRDVPLQVCIDRDRSRAKAGYGVGEDVIRHLAAQHLTPLLKAGN